MAEKKVKKILSKVKLQVEAGKATPAHPIGTSLGPHGLNLMEFCKQFNDQTKGQSGIKIPAIVTIYADRSFSFITKSPPAALLILKEVGIEKGAATPNKEEVGTITISQLQEIAKIKMKDLNARDMDMAVRILSGTCRAMGVAVKP